MTPIEDTHIRKEIEAYTKNPSPEAFYSLPLPIGFGAEYGEWWWLKHHVYIEQGQ